MKIKSLLVLGAMMLPGLSFSTNYFKIGTQWTVRVGSEPSTMVTIVYSLDDGPVTETEDSGALRLMSITGEGEQTLEAIILSEGEKVYFWNEEKEWCLLYDFSLQPGEETVLYSGMYTPDSQDYPESVEATCDKITTSNETLPYEGSVLFLTTFLPQTESPYSSAVWYDGIGSMQGPLANFENTIDGIPRTLVKVTSGDDVIFDYDKFVGVATVTDNEEGSASVAHRLDGSPDNGQPGIVVSKGKKWLRKKF